MFIFGHYAEHPAYSLKMSKFGSLTMSSLLFLVFSCLPTVHSETQAEHFATLTTAANKANQQQEPVKRMCII
jgi:hypothetical protein